MPKPAAHALTWCQSQDCVGQMTTTLRAEMLVFEGAHSAKRWECGPHSPGIDTVGSQHRDLFALSALAFSLVVVCLFNGM